MKIILFVLVISAASYADGDCTQRPLTPAEKAFDAKVRSLVAALPKAPAGWRADDVEVNGLTEMCTENDAALKAGEQRLGGNVFVQFHNTEDRTGALRKAAAGPSARDQQRLEEIQQQMLKLMNDAGGDPAKLQAAAPRMEKLQKELSAISEKLQAERAPAFAEAMRDMQASVSIGLGSVERPADAIPCEHIETLKVPGAAAAVRLECPTQAGRTGGDNDVSGDTIVLFGPWKTSIDGQDFNAQAPRKGAYTDAYTAEIHIHADKDRAAQLLKALKLDVVRAAIGSGR